MRDFEQELATMLAAMAADPTERHQFQPQFHKLLADMKDAGLNPTEKLQALDATLVDEGVEALFDNFPV